MTHEELRLLLAEHAAGQLGTQEDRAVSEHLSSCADCRESVAAWRTLAQTRDQHVASGLLVAAVLQRESLAAGQMARIDQHVASCETCRAEFRSVQVVDQDLQRVRRTTLGRGWRWVTLAASLGLAAFLVQAWFSIHPPSQLEVGGAFELPVLRGGARGGEDVPTVSPRKSDRITPLAIVPSLPLGLSPQAELLFELRNEQTVVYSLQFSVEQVQQLSQTSQAMVLLVPTERLNAGPHRLTMRRVDAEELLLDVGFKVRPRGAE